MTTQYTPILALALPVTGELSGTWGDVVNDNITSMVEQAIAGLATINTWSANGHTLTTADGLSAESRCAMLVLTDTGTALSGAATVVCPTASKIYIVKNTSGQSATITTAAGTGVAIPNGETMFVFCDGTNVVQAVTRIASADVDFAKLKGTGAVVVTNILDEDNMASDSATALATQQSIKAYVDSQISANNDLSEILANGNTTGGTDIAVSAGDDITFTDTSKAIFGAGSDLQIYHDGTNSRIEDINGANLILRSSADVRIDKYTGENMGVFNADGSVDLYYDNSKKLATTSTGIDVTGDVVADGLTVEGLGLFDASNAKVTIKSFAPALILDDDSAAGANSDKLILQSVAAQTLGDYEFVLNNDQTSSTDRTAIKIAGNGDISFYEDTGTTAKLTWDASAESLNFADNAKAIFGDGSDLQIYHDGSASYIAETGTGPLNIQMESTSTAIGSGSALINFLAKTGASLHTAANLSIHQPATTEGVGDFRFSVGDGAGVLTEALRVNSAGIDVTGTVVADGLTVDGGTANGVTYLNGSKVLTSGSALTFDGSNFKLTGSDNNNLIWSVNSNAGAQSIRIQANVAGLYLQGSGTVDPLYITQSSATGYIVFRPASDTEGMRLTSAGLGIGTSSPGFKLDVQSASTGTVASFRGSSASRFLYITSSTTTNDGDTYTLDSTSSSGVLAFATTSTERMRINSSGNVGIGTSSPGAKLDVRLVNDRGLYVEGLTSSPVYLRSYQGSVTSNLREIGFKGSDIRFETGSSTGTSTTERLRIDSSGNVGIGTSSPTSISGYTGATLNNATNGGFIDLQNNGTTAFRFLTNGSVNNIETRTATPIVFLTNTVERMRIDSSGNLLVGKTTTASESVGVMALSTGRIFGTVNSDDVLLLRRNTTDGAIATFRKDGTTVGSIGTEGGDVWMGNNNCGLQFIDNTEGVRSVRPFDPSTNARSDNTVDLGQSTTRFDDIYATNGTIQTSDRNEKQDIEVLSEAEARVAVACKGLLRKFRWKDAVAEKGDEARIHFGIIAQDLQDAFAAEGLDAGRYAMFISSTWTDEETGEERTRLGVRYPELLAFIIAAI